MRRLILAVLTALTAAPLVGAAARADRAVGWTTASEGALERELNAGAARGLRVAAVSDGLPCTVTVMQAPARPSPPAQYAVVADKDLEARLPELVAARFVPKLAHRSQFGKAHVIFERAAPERPAAPLQWRLVDFPDLSGLEPAMSTASADGFEARIVVRYPFKTWPKLSERGLILASKSPGAKPRETRVLIGQSQKIDATAKGAADLAAQGYSLNLLFTGSRDGSREMRRERLVLVLSRESGTTTAAAPVRLDRTSSFGTFGSGIPLGAAPFWDEYYVYAWSPAERRTTWATPIHLSANEATCLGLPLKLRVDAPRDQTPDIVGLVARKLPMMGWELVYLTDQRIGG